MCCDVGGSGPADRKPLRRDFGYALANTGADTRAIQDWLGHRSIAHTVSNVTADQAIIAGSFTKRKVRLPYVYA